MRAARFLLLFVFVCASSAKASTIPAASCSRSDVGSAVNSAKAGDIIVIPAGTCTWTSTLEVAKAFTIQGAGIGQTVIVDQVNKSSFSGLLQSIQWHCQQGGVNRLTGLSIKGGAGVQDNYNKGMVQIDGNCDQFRFDHNRLDLNESSGLFVYGYVRGVVDHNIFQANGWHFGIYAHNGSSWGGVGDFGDNSWATDAPLGTANALFVEDNDFRAPGGFTTAIDGWMGSRIVFRHNTLLNAAFENHGTETSGRWRSQRSHEVYENDFLYDSQYVWNGFIASRGGTGVVWNNRMVTRSPAWQTIASSVVALRYSDKTRVYDPFGWCPNGWDGGSNGPCLDAPGRGKGALLSGFDPGTPRNLNQAAEPVYHWNNTIDGVVTAVNNQSPGGLQEGRDYFNSPKPGYAPYQYPHPLQSGAAAPSNTNTTPAPPQNLRIVAGQ